MNDPNKLKQIRQLKTKALSGTLDIGLPKDDQIPENPQIKDL